MSRLVSLTFAPPPLHLPGEPGVAARRCRAGVGRLRRLVALERADRSARHVTCNSNVSPISSGWRSRRRFRRTARTVAFVARAGSKRQIWRRLLAGGAPLQITRDDVDHEQPRWAPDSSSLIYYVPSATPGEHGTIWEIPALGGEPRRIASALSGGDISHDGRRIALFRFEGDADRAGAWSARDGSGADQLRPMPPRQQLRVSRGGRRMIAGLRFNAENLGGGFDGRRSRRRAATEDEPARDRAQCRLERSLLAAKRLGCRLQLLLQAALCSIRPSFNLRAVERDGTGDRQLTFGDRVLRGARRARVRHVGSEPDPHAIGHLEISGQWVAGGEHTPREFASHIRPARRRPLR